jgi:Putative adipose-regulatory protein (Seipin)
VILDRATLRVKTQLYGLRYVMREWFFTTALLVISTTGFMIFLGVLAFITVAK